MDMSVVNNHLSTKMKNKMSKYEGWELNIEKKFTSITLPQCQ